MHFYYLKRLNPNSETSNSKIFKSYSCIHILKEFITQHYNIKKIKKSNFLPTEYSKLHNILHSNVKCQTFILKFLFYFYYLTGNYHFGWIYQRGKKDTKF